MTPVELGGIVEEAHHQEFLQKNLLEAAELLADAQTDPYRESVIGFVADPDSDYVSHRYWFPRSLAQEEANKALTEAFDDILRLAQMRLEVKAREASNKHRLLSEQLLSFISDGAPQ